VLCRKRSGFLMYGKERFEYFAPLIQRVFSLYCRVLLLRFSRLECPSYRTVGEVAARNRRIVFYCVYRGISFPNE